MHRKGRKGACFGRHRFVSLPLSIRLGIRNTTTKVVPRLKDAARPLNLFLPPTWTDRQAWGLRLFIPGQKASILPNFFSFDRKALENLRPQIPRRMAGACLTLIQHLCIYAQYHPGKYCGLDLRRGQIFTGRLALKEATGLSERTIRSAIKTLERMGEVTSRPTRQGTVYTVVNYDAYDHVKRDGEPKATNNRPAGGHIQRSTKKEKKIPMESPGSVPPENQSQKQPEKPAPRPQSPPKKLRIEDFKDPEDYWAAVREDNRKTLLQLPKGSLNHPDTPFVRGK